MSKPKTSTSSSQDDVERYDNDVIEDDDQEGNFLFVFIHHGDYR